MTIKKNIFLKQAAETLPYKSVKQNIGKHIPKREPQAHAEYLRKQFAKCYAESRTSDLTEQQTAAVKSKGGTYLDIRGAKGYDLVTKSLENRRKGIHLLTVKQDEESKEIHATIFVPFGQEKYFLDKLHEYAAEKTKKGKPKNNDLISSIESVQLAFLRAFWTSKRECLPKEHPVWCELWLRFDGTQQENVENWESVERRIVDICKKLQITIGKQKIVFPERLVKLVYADARQLQQLIDCSGDIAEIRHAQEPVSFFTELPTREQKYWVDDLLARTDYERDGGYVCLLDTGIYNQHPLLLPATQDKNIQAVNPQWEPYDKNGHGTEMAGVVLFNDLQKVLESQNKIQVLAGLESVKILEDGEETPYKLYGSITKNAVSFAEIANPDVKRIFCMAVTANSMGDIEDGRPTSWSAAIDAITSGAEEENAKRLFVISAGNVWPDEFERVGYPEANRLHSVESPGQAWNAITVGAYAGDKWSERWSQEGMAALARPRELSPYSSSSATWSPKWPIKPEVLFWGGNVISDGKDYLNGDEVGVLTTARPKNGLFSSIWGTSAATAQAAWFCSQIAYMYPGIWPETIRALVIHSAQWTEDMRRQFCLEKTKTAKRNLLRFCGYGVPNLERAIQCLNNRVNLVIQGEIQPYAKDKMHEMHIYTLPWPKEILRSLDNVPVTVRVTLSYFIEPGPGEVGWKDRYRYPSCGLRFDLNNSNEELVDFEKRINAQMREEDKYDKGNGSSGSERWYLGPKNRNVGSIHSDFLKTSAVNLCNCNYVAVYPVTGWWRERSYLGRSEKKVRYALVVSLETPKQDVDFYTPILTEVENRVQISV